MPERTIEQRVAELERQMSALQTQTAERREKDWRRTIGLFDGDEAMKRILDEALKYREQNRKEARCRSKRRRAKS